MTYLPDEPPEPAPSPAVEAEAVARPAPRRGVVRPGTAVRDRGGRDAGARARVRRNAARRHPADRRGRPPGDRRRARVADTRPRRSPRASTPPSSRRSCSSTRSATAGEATPSTGEGTGVVINDAGRHPDRAPRRRRRDDDQADASPTGPSRRRASPTREPETRHRRRPAPTSRRPIVVPATLGNPGAVQIGSEAYVVGNPFGLYGSMSAGVVSGPRPLVPGSRTAAPVLHGLIQVDAAVNPGNSGGPLLDRDGRVVGIVTALVNPTKEDVFIGIGLAVPDRRRRRRRRPAPVLSSTKEAHARGPRPEAQPTAPPRWSGSCTRSRRSSSARTTCSSGWSSPSSPAATSSSRACPGLAKTMAIKTLAESIGGDFKRIQFTPDLVPADLVGTRIYNQKTGEFSDLARAGLHEPAPRRRDQPRAGQGPERAARGDAGAPGDDRPRDLQGARTRSSSSRPRTRSRPRARTRCRRRRSTGSCSRSSSATRRPTEEFAIVERMTGRARARSSRSSRPTSLLALQQAADRVYVDPALLRVRGPARDRDPRRPQRYGHARARSATSRSGPARARRST